MAYGDREHGDHRRAAAGIATAAIHGALAAALLWGLTVDAGRPPGAPPALATFDLAPPPPPPPPPAKAPPRSEAAPQAAAPEGRTGEALPREAPPAAIPLSPAPAAPVSGEGRDAHAGAGAHGSGTGAGGQGPGAGGGGGGGVATPAQRIAGALRDSDYPRALADQGLAGTVAIGFRVRTDGRVDRCTVVRSSGHPALDELTCRLFTERYRFRPATTAAGAPVETTLQTSFTWGTRRRR